MNNRNHRSTIGLRKSTKEKLDKLRAPGQCYDGLLRQIIDKWEKEEGDRKITNTISRQTNYL